MSTVILIQNFLGHFILSIILPSSPESQTFKTLHENQLYLIRILTEPDSSKVNNYLKLVED